MVIHSTQIQTCHDTGAGKRVLLSTPTVDPRAGMAPSTTSSAMGRTSRCALLLPGQAYESTQFEALVTSVRVQRLVRHPRSQSRRIGGSEVDHTYRIRQWR